MPDEPEVTTLDDLVQRELDWLDRLAAESADDGTLATAYPTKQEASHV